MVIISVVMILVQQSDPRQEINIHLMRCKLINYPDDLFDSNSLICYQTPDTIYICCAVLIILALPPWIHVGI